MPTPVSNPAVWTERGTWRGVEATLTLSFAPRDEGCVVTAEVSVSGPGVWRLLGPLVAGAADLAVPGDLQRAARILSARAT